MNLSNIERLEQKIDQIVQQMTIVKERNRELEKENTELKSMLDDRNRLVQSLENKLDEVQKQSYETEQFREREEKIKEKISSMLEKLDHLESIV